MSLGTEPRINHTDPCPGELLSGEGHQTPAPGSCHPGRGILEDDARPLHFTSDEISAQRGRVTRPRSRGAETRGQSSGLCTRSTLPLPVPFPSALSYRFFLPGASAYNFLLL